MAKGEQGFMEIGTMLASGGWENAHRANTVVFPG